MFQYPDYTSSLQAPSRNKVGCSLASEGGSRLAWGRALRNNILYEKNVRKKTSPIPSNIHEFKIWVRYQLTRKYLNYFSKNIIG